MIADHARNNEFVLDAVFIGFLDRGMRIGKAGAFTIDNGGVGFGDTIPALVAIHRVIAAADGGNAHMRETCDALGELVDKTKPALRRRIAAVEESVNRDGETRT